MWQVLDAGLDVNVTAQDFAAVVAQFPQYIKTHQEGLKGRVGGARLPEQGSLSRPGLPVSLEEAERVLSLAKNVYRCEGASNQGWGGDFWMTSGEPVQTLLGWHDIANHHHCYKCRPIEYRPGVRVMKPYCDVTLHEKSTPLSSILITLAGLDPATATIAGMDARDARFAFTRKSIPCWWGSDYMVFTWRGLVSCHLQPNRHWILIGRPQLLDFAEEYHRHGLDPPTIRLASEEEADMSRTHSSSLLSTAKAWSCNHCQKFFAEANAETKSVILNHVQERYGLCGCASSLSDLTHLSSVMESQPHKQTTTT